MKCLAKTVNTSTLVRPNEHSIRDSQNTKQLSRREMRTMVSPCMLGRRTTDQTGKELQLRQQLNSTGVIKF